MSYHEDPCSIINPRNLQFHNHATFKSVRFVYGSGAVFESDQNFIKVFKPDKHVCPQII